MFIDPGWFPLVARPRPPGQPLAVRIAGLTELAALLPDSTGHQLASRAAEILNKSALVTSDCGFNELARELCFRYFRIFNEVKPWPTWAAGLAVQPILNIPRQLIRDGRGAEAHALLETLLAAARAQAIVVIDGHVIDLRAITDSPKVHQDICTHIWTALLADGTRALIQARRWTEAAQYAGFHRGIGTRLLDGRQAAILAHLYNGRPSDAAAMVDQSQTIGSSEHAVQCLLRVLCQQAAGTVTRADTDLMVGAALASMERNDPSTVVARTRIGLAALSLASDTHTPIEALQARIISLATSDAYAARDLLQLQAHIHLTATQSNDLQSVLRVCSLGARKISKELHRHLTSAVTQAEASLTRALIHPSGSPIHEPYRREHV
ncbi:hypothetical protein I6A60_33790 [Frankia sp. AgB1.9]|uniref:hypothetical protein n=1 Tax=unclassified Frankia TaxID=2632575 RepID=UPI0019349086|nr:MULTISPECIES: hypothetical protein [unclassified Frankia]MBL7493723.1 hypothetical protein [Frankia sp. AgW1.1]MBL7552793.1 hypothetical protein [Frankia sp. AgB1.9]MBL7625401.1 hypothetical protein [Frankia sp. AgB1.8]